MMEHSVICLSLRQKDRSRSYVSGGLIFISPFFSEERKQAAAKQTLTELEERRMTIDECQLYVPSVNEIETEVAKRRACEASGFYE